MKVKRKNIWCSVAFDGVILTYRSVGLWKKIFQWAGYQTFFEMPINHVLSYRSDCDGLGTSFSIQFHSHNLKKELNPKQLKIYGVDSSMVQHIAGHLNSIIASTKAGTNVALLGVSRKSIDLYYRHKKTNSLKTAGHLH